MNLDLDSIRIRHPRVPAEFASDAALHAAVALARRHASGVSMSAAVLLDQHEVTLRWRARPAEDAEQLDEIRATELAAEAIALALVHATRGWVVKRRLQRGTFADWLLVDQSGGLVALEVSGTDDGSAQLRMKEKLDQVGKCKAASVKVACVVRLVEPMAAVEQAT